MKRRTRRSFGVVRLIVQGLLPVTNLIFSIGVGGDSPTAAQGAYILDLQGQGSRHGFQRQFENRASLAAEKLGRHVNDDLIQQATTQETSRQGRACLD